MTWWTKGAHGFFTGSIKRSGRGGTLKRPALKMTKSKSLKWSRRPKLPSIKTKKTGWTHVRADARESVDVAINPSYSDVMKLARSGPFGQVRVMKAGKKVYAWNADEATHGSVIKGLGSKIYRSSSEVADLGLLARSGRKFMNMDVFGDANSHVSPKWFRGTTTRRMSNMPKLKSVSAAIKIRRGYKR